MPWCVTSGSPALHLMCSPFLFASDGNEHQRPRYSGSWRDLDIILAYLNVVGVFQGSTAGSPFPGTRQTSELSAPPITASVEASIGTSLHSAILSGMFSLSELSLLAFPG